MKKTNWIRYWEIMRYYGFDLARIFPILIKQRGTSKLISGVSSHIIEAPSTFWVYFLNLDYQLSKLITSLVPGLVVELSMQKISSLRLETVFLTVLQ
jgi:ABC-type transport system involved in cytochrome c biogenesis permease subunit